MWAELRRSSHLRLSVRSLPTWSLQHGRSRVGAPLSCCAGAPKVCVPRAWAKQTVYYPSCPPSEIMQHHFSCTYKPPGFQEREQTPPLEGGMSRSPCEKNMWDGRYFCGLLWKTQSPTGKDRGSTPALAIKVILHLENNLHNSVKLRASHSHSFCLGLWACKVRGKALPRPLSRPSVTPFSPLSLNLPAPLWTTASVYSPLPLSPCVFSLGPPFLTPSPSPIPPPALKSSGPTLLFLLWLHPLLHPSQNLPLPSFPFSH